MRRPIDDEAGTLALPALVIPELDAAVAALSEQLGVQRLATTDRRHFPAIGRDMPLELLPPGP